MKLSMNRKDLKKALLHVISAVAKKPQTPILGCVLLTPQDNKIELYANNFQTASSAFVPAQIDNPQPCAIPGGQFLEIVGKLSGEIVVLETDAYNISIKSDAANFIVRGASPDDFPLFGVIDTCCSFSIRAALFKKLVRLTAFATFNGEKVNHIFSGINFNLKDSILTATASNSRQIAVCSATVDYSGDNANFTVPLAGLNMARELDDDAELIVSISKSAAEFDARLFTFKTKLIDGVFPTPDKIFADLPNCTFSATVDLKELSSALSRIDLIARSSFNRAVRLNFTDEGLEASAADTNGNTVVEHIDATTNGSFRAIYNIDNLRDLLSAAWINKIERITFSMSQPLTPLFARFPGDDSFSYATSPIRN